jgi:hypothetical protein
MSRTACLPASVLLTILHQAEAFVGTEVVLRRSSDGRRINPGGAAAST